MWATQAQIHERVQDETQELKTTVEWVRDQLIDLQKQVILKYDGILLNCVLPLFGSTLVPTTGNKSNFTNKTYMIMLP